MNCDMCGTIEEPLFRVVVEGTELSVCKKCTKFGKVIAPIRTEQHKMASVHTVHKVGTKNEVPQRKEIIEVIVEDYGSIIRAAREKLGLNQEDFAKKLNEKLSLIHNMEINRFKPNIELARKLEKLLRVKLVEQAEESSGELPKVKSNTFTLGDFIKVKKKDTQPSNMNPSQSPEETE
jgi:putative transcription factor